MGGASVLTAEDRLTQAQAQLAQMRDVENELCAQIEKLKKEKTPGRGRLP